MRKWLDRMELDSARVIGLGGMALVFCVAAYTWKLTDDRNEAKVKDANSALDLIEKNGGELTIKLTEREIADLRAEIERWPGAADEPLAKRLNELVSPKPQRRE